MSNAAMRVLETDSMCVRTKQALVRPRLFVSENTAHLEVRSIQLVSRETMCASLLAGAKQGKRFLTRPRSCRRSRRCQAPEHSRPREAASSTWILLCVRVSK